MNCSDAVSVRAVAYRFAEIESRKDRQTGRLAEVEYPISSDMAFGLHQAVNLLVAYDGSLLEMRACVRLCVCVSASSAVVDGSADHI